MTRAFHRLQVVASLATVAIPLAGCLPEAGTDQQGLASDPAKEQVHPSGFYIDPERSLLVRSSAITDNAVRTLDPCYDRDHGVAAGDVASSKTWTFGYLMKQMANGRDPAIFAYNWLANWKLSTTVNGDPLVTLKRSDGGTLPGRIYDAWQRASGGTPGNTVALKMNRAPFRLLAIVNRFDLRNPKPPRFGEGNAGELRFVFSVLDLDQREQTGRCLQAAGDSGDSRPGDDLLILEYAVDRADSTAVQNWITSWTNLPGNGFDETYASNLEGLTQQVVRAGAGGSRQNGSELIRLRTNESVNGTEWELREFQMNSTGYLFPSTVKQTPTNANQTDPALNAWINANGQAILDDTYTLPATYLGAHATNIKTSSRWGFATIDDENVLHAAAVRTCNGCHGVEAGTIIEGSDGNGNGFSHITGRLFGDSAKMSGFLTGSDASGAPFCAPDPRGNGTPLFCFGDLQRRSDDILSYLNTGL